MLFGHRFCHKVTLVFLSQNHRIDVWFERTSGKHPVQLPVKAGPPGAGDTAAHPGGVWVSPERRLQDLPAQLSQCAAILNTKKVFPILRGNFLCFTL